MQIATKLKLRLISLTCYLSEENDADEVFLKYNNKKIWPQDKKFEKLKQNKINIHFELDELDKNSVVTLQLWEYDLWNSNDHLGNFDLIINERGGPFQTDLQKIDSSFGRYTLEWESY